MPDHITADELLDVYMAFGERYTDRDDRYDTMTDILKKDWDLTDSGGDPIDIASPNLIGTALEDTAEASSAMPTIRVRPSTVEAASKRTAAEMEQIGLGYFDLSRIELEIPRYVMDLGAFGLCPLVVLPDWDRQSPVIVKRDPRLTWPEPTYHPGDTPHRVLFVQERHFTQLPPEYQMVLDEQVQRNTNRQTERDKVILVEYVTDYEYTLGALIHLGHARTAGRNAVNWKPVILDQVENPIGICPVVPMSRPTWDNEFRGQFDDVIEPLLAHARLMAMRIEYADQSVYSDVWVRDVIGDMPFGGGSFIQLGPNGAIGRVPPAVTSLDLYRDLERLEDLIHVGGRWPKSRPGQVDQAIASGKFVEATVGMMSTVIKTHHQVLARGLAQALRICFAVDKAYFGGKAKMVTGVSRNQAFSLEYDPADAIDLAHKVTVEYGLGLGRDPQSSAALMLGYASEEYISREFVQENIDGLTDVSRERKRIDLERIEAMMFARLLQGIEAGEIPMEVLPDIHEAREAGRSLVEIYREFVIPDPTDIDPLAALLGLAPPGGAPMLGGAPPGPVGPEALPVPAAPPPAELTAALPPPPGA